MTDSNRDELLFIDPLTHKFFTARKVAVCEDNKYPSGAPILGYFAPLWVRSRPSEWIDTQTLEKRPNQVLC